MDCSCCEPIERENDQRANLSTKRDIHPFGDDIVDEGMQQPVGEAPPAPPPPPEMPEDLDGNWARPERLESERFLNLRHRQRMSESTIGLHICLSQTGASTA